MTHALPVLYTFRRCPYAMRARLAIQAAHQLCELREIVLRDKAPEFLGVSPSGTVPMLLLPDGTVIDESLDIMRWALTRHDPEHWLEVDDGGWIARNDGPFKRSLDRYKYPTRFDKTDPLAEREKAVAILDEYEERLAWSRCLFRATPSLADMAILPFVRQFASVDADWWSGLARPHVKRWLGEFVSSGRFDAVMLKYPKWQVGDAPTLFGVA
ncbi:glutathione S-transferase [Phyllobacterium myrsinacearum]|uniref:Glutathione S-transferase n=1 Tax=Phyllobacterium myrsinacearum TaxID=28101 RepID=A0A2S9JA66_9HYPH|nr:glutathione S-transferase [Phyllobacterium myrsinacearum]PRD49670.1 glutathione S-transferase [Phyllobacterium myrsinacearum]PWV94746.1 glutathione S-transferase [Phyllobacterium myrsinacearum]RZV07145.1 glutathione S-transferase [Phyllobacterium myrsinacearum]